MKRAWIGWVVGGLIGLGLGFLAGWHAQGRPSTTSRLSPDETIVARFVELNPFTDIDRKVEIRMETPGLGGSRVLFQSKEQGKPAGSERLIWSTDGTKLLLVGRHFFVKEDLFLDNGDQLFFFHDFPTNRSWSNEIDSGLPLLKAEMVRGVAFTEPVRLRGE